jgi:benzoyl-CoA reductase subunit C
MLELGGAIYPRQSQIMPEQAAAVTEFSEVADDPLAWVKQWKEAHGGIVIGCLPMYAPEELIAAAGMLAIALPGTDKPIVLSNAYLHTNLCHPMRGNFELALGGELSFIDGLVFCDVCDQSRRLGSVWEIYHQLGFAFHLRLPKRLDTKEAKYFYKDELQRLRTSLEEFAGHRISDEDLRRSIAVYNHSRELLSKLYELRRKSPTSFQATEVDAIVTAAMVMPKEEFRQSLALYLDNKQITPVPQSQRAKVLVCGNPCEDMEPKLLDMIGDVGGVIVDDYVYPGSMYLSQPVSEQDAPIDALAQAYIDSSPCPTKHNLNKNWGDYVVNRAKQAKVDGVIVLLPKYCEIYAFDYPDAREKLRQAGIPHIMLEVAHSGADARLRTRVEAFMETLRTG